ncbi:DUF6069 family protein [Streptosporangium sp. NPDC020145]|uniref:DUF6069 family protein n=1 Tax=Streptosporangium sp. NPDC020145 TaxID=3154694 RepID=UPI00342D3915
MADAARVRPVWIVVGAVLGALAVNLLIWLIGRGLGGSFVYLEAGGRPHTTTAPQGVITMTVVPMTAGLVAAALLGSRWPVMVRVAQVAGPLLALATVAMTFTAGFDGVSQIALTSMHVVIAVVVAGALQLLARTLGSPDRASRSTAAA